jgi:DNA-binding CsgD family transcriptional regulator
MTTPDSRPTRIRIAIVASDSSARQALGNVFRDVAGLDVFAWSDSVESLIELGTRADVCVCATAPPAEQLARLRDNGVAVVVVDGDPVAAVRAAVSAGPGPGVQRPKLSDRQRDVLIAYASTNDLLPTVARRLGMDPETVKTHLRRIRAKYGDVERPAPTRRDLYVRAVEDGLLPPPTGRSDH